MLRKRKPNYKSQADQMVYKLYDLTEEEIAIVEKVLRLKMLLRMNF